MQTHFCVAREIVLFFTDEKCLLCTLPPLCLSISAVCVTSGSRMQPCLEATNSSAIFTGFAELLRWATRFRIQDLRWIFAGILLKVLDERLSYKSWWLILFIVVCAISHPSLILSYKHWFVEMLKCHQTSQVWSVRRTQTARNQHII